MTRFPITWPSGRVLMLATASIMMAACAEDNGKDFCRNHHLVHAQHAEAIGKLTMSISTEGQLTNEFQTPPGISGKVEVGEMVALQFGEEGGLRQIDVSVFDLLPDLEEIEVYVSTPVTQKRFAISRQCESPIFRLN